MSKKVFYSLFIIIVIYGLWSLPYSPIVWFDEVYFASITHSFINGDGLTVALDHGEPCYVYGPIYFLLTGLFTKVLGFGVFSFRLVNYLFSLLSVICLGKILDTINVKKGLNYFFQILLLTDQMFVSDAHSGRMEFVALFFVLLAYLFYLDKKKSEAFRTVIIAISLTAAMLTTPRVVFIIIPIALFYFVHLIKERSWWLSSLYVLLPVIIYGSWLLIAYGSVNGMLDSFTQNDATQGDSLWNHFFSGNWHISIYHYPMVATTIALLVYAVVKKDTRRFNVFVLPIILFYFFVFDLGMYAVLILPFYIIIMSLGVSAFEAKESKTLRVACSVMLAICMIANASIFIMKGSTVVVTKDQRSPYLMAEWFKKNIPSGSKVAGDYAYYYAAIENGCDFKRINREKTDLGIVFNDLKENFQPDYIVLSYETEKLKEKPEFAVFNVEEVSGYEVKDSPLVQKVLTYTGMYFASSYKGTIYEVQ